MDQALFSHVFVRRGAQRGPLLADFLRGQAAGEDVSPEQQRGVEKRGSAARLRSVRGSPRAIREMVEVRHVKHRGTPVVEVS